MKEKKRANEVVGQTAQSDLQGLDDIGVLLIEMESSAEDEQDTRHLVGVVELDPRLELLSERRGGNSGEPDSSGLTGHLELGHRKRVDSFGKNDLFFVSLNTVSIQTPR